jgi:hypothetical protein
LIVKLHPLESNIEAYQREGNDCVEILPIASSLNEELKRAKIQVSIYSTTFFDALGMQVRNYSLNDIGYSADYASEMVDFGVAEALDKSENVISKFERSSDRLDNLKREHVYAAFQPRLMNF